MTLRGERILCCHCGLAHDHDYKIITKGKRRLLYMRVVQHPVATANSRRPFKFSKDED
jgi:hypothetical protein